MSRIELVAATAAALFLAFALGWLACRLVHRLSRASTADIGELDRLAQSLHEAEAERDAAIDAHEAAVADLSARLHDAENERGAAMAGMREAQAEAENLRAWIERTQAV